MTAIPINQKEHWESIYQSKAISDVSWFQTQSTQSINLITRAAPDRAAQILDMGSGATTLLGSLLDCGYRQITAVDISSAALEKAKQQLGPRASQIEWLEADVTRLQLPLAFRR